jgi:proline iminopeptidase
MLAVDGRHSIYWEESGNPDGSPVLFLHGGPGMGTKSHNRCFFDPKRYRIILFDQRGSGKSLPLGCLEDNTTWHLVSDIEKLRSHVKVEKWVLFGGSWGSTLALTYSILHTSRVEGLILRGIFLSRLEDIRWFHQKGASAIFPDFWQHFIAPIAPNERSNLIKAFYQKLTSKDQNERRAATKAWSIWGGKTFKLIWDDEPFNDALVDSFYPSVLIESHYLFHNSFLESDNWILENVSVLSHLPCAIVHGRYDMVCPVQGAWDLHRALSKSKLTITQEAGHSSSESQTLSVLVETTNAFATL